MTIQKGVIKVCVDQKALHGKRPQATAVMDQEGHDE